ncbi:ABC transporter permease [Psychrobacillus sp. MER TA 171]|nr:ABC transporter permease subunit [Psychrobacillus sp. MER TA 171]MCM3357865.1 ABC transporter permease [Psychrobacillus sp. MER TA 171]
MKNYLDCEELNVKIFLFEIKKILHAKAFTIFILLTVLFICGLYTRNVLQQDMISATKVQQFSEHRGNVFQEIERNRQELETASDPEAENKLNAALNLYDEITELIQAVQDKKWEVELATEIKVYQSAIAYQDMNGNFRQSKADMLDTISLNEELLKEGLPKEGLNLSIQTSLFMKNVVALLLNPFGFLVLLLILGTSITREFEEKNIQMVYVLPLSRHYYLMNKFVSFFVLGVLWMSIVFLTSFLLPYLFTDNMENGFSYPLATTEGNFLTSGNYLREAFSYSFVYMIFSVALITLTGFLVRNTIISYLLIIFLHIGNYIVLVNDFVYQVNPFTYGMIDLAVLNDKTKVFFGGSLLLGVSIILILVAIYMSKRRGT